jgi:hypothetical protein
MSETLNVNVLVAAKEEYTRQLVKTIQEDIYEVIKDIFNDSQEKNIRRKISFSNFQLELKSVPEWTSYKLDSKINHIPKKYPFLMDLITAIFVSHVKILACVRLKSDDKSIKIKVPNLNTFLHKLLIRCCESLYYEPHIIHMEKHKMMDIIGIAIDDTIANQIPIEYILQEYLSGAFDDVPEMSNLMAQEEPLEDISDQESETNSEDGQYKNIPILPIKGKHSINSLPITKNLDGDDSSEHENENEKNIDDENTNEKNYENINENTNEKNYENINEKSTEILKKSSQIEDESDEDYSEDEVSGDEVSGDEDAPKDKKSRSLF